MSVSLFPKCGLTHCPCNISVYDEDEAVEEEEEFDGSLNQDDDEAAAYEANNYLEIDE
jgi:hypothetical protein